jgi:hypothetical protein
LIAGYTSIITSIPPHHQYPVLGLPRVIAHVAGIELECERTSAGSHEHIDADGDVVEPQHSHDLIACEVMQPLMTGSQKCDHIGPFNHLYDKPNLELRGDPPYVYLFTCDGLVQILIAK